MFVARPRDVGGGRVIEQGPEAGIVVHTDIAIEVLERALFIRAFVGPVMVGRLDLLVLWRFHGPKVALRGELLVKVAFAERPRTL